MGIQSCDISIFSGLPRSFIRQIEAFATKVSYRKGGLLFRQGDSASHFFTLEKGRIALCIGSRCNVIYKVENGQEAFGWSSLIGGDRYTASAVSVVDTMVLKYDSRKLRAFLAEHSVMVLRFYHNLSRTLDRRLHYSKGLLSFLSGHPKSKVAKGGGTRDSFDLLS